MRLSLGKDEIPKVKLEAWEGWPSDEDFKAVLMQMADEAKMEDEYLADETLNDEGNVKLEDESITDGRRIAVPVKKNSKVLSNPKTVQNSNPTDKLAAMLRKVTNGLLNLVKPICGLKQKLKEVSQFLNKI